jgi:DNA-binding NarL/FixJ family response regulator
MEAILQSSGFTVVGHWTDGGEALAAAELPGVDLLILARRLIEVSGLANSFRPLDGDYVGKIIVVLEPEDDFSTKDFVTLEVEGLLLSSAGVEEVRDCVASVEHGRRWVDPGIRLLLGHAEPPHPDYRGLSERELEVVRLAASGMSNKRIARALQVSDGTVKMHMHHVLAKQRLVSRSDLVWPVDDIPAASAAKGQALHLVDPDRGSSKVLTKSSA